jgi:DNA repair photolyase
MLEVFLGGYLFHPAATDYSGDTCLNGCAYCFANINKEARAGNLKGAISALYKKEPKSYQDLLIYLGYPICVSNRSDPFTDKNCRDTIAFFTHLAEHKNGVFIQTKTGPGLDEALEIMGDRRDVVVYITVTTLDDDLAAVIEPKAPRPSERLKSAKRLHDAGYLVIVAINPCTEAWMPLQDLETLTKILKADGLNHVCLEMLDIKRKRLSLLSEARKRRMGEAIDMLGTRNRDYVRECTQYLVGQGFAVAKRGMPYRTTFFDDIKARLGVTMPVLQDFVNYCFDKYGISETVLSYDEFEQVIARDGIFTMAIKQNNIRDYLFRCGFISWKANQQIHSHKELLRVIWNDPRPRISIQGHSLFTPVGKNGRYSLDKNGNVQLYFDGLPNLSKKKGVIK